MASVAGLAPARLRWKDGLLERLCIHGRLMSYKLQVEGCRLARIRTVAKLATFNLQPATKVAPKVGIAPTSPPLQGGANLPQLLGGARRARIANGRSPIAKECLRNIRLLAIDDRLLRQRRWLSRAVMLRGLPVIGRVLCY